MIICLLKDTVVSKLLSCLGLRLSSTLRKFESIFIPTMFNPEYKIYDPLSPYKYLQEIKNPTVWSSNITGRPSTATRDNEFFTSELRILGFNGS
eukprot:Pgem_evm1s3173